MFVYILRYAFYLVILEKYFNLFPRLFSPGTRSYVLYILREIYKECTSDLVAPTIRLRILVYLYISTGYLKWTGLLGQIVKNLYLGKDLGLQRKRLGPIQ